MKKSKNDYRRKQLAKARRRNASNILAGRAIKKMLSQSRQSRAVRRYGYLYDGKTLTHTDSDGISTSTRS